MRHAFLAALLVLPACGTTAEISRDERDRDDAAMDVRADHDDVVRIAGDTDDLPAEGDACPEACRRHERVSSLTERICGVSERDEHGEATRFLCEDARERRSSTERRSAACSCT
jgi:hypothetical protein